MESEALDSEELETAPPAQAKVDKVDVVCRV